MSNRGEWTGAGLDTAGIPSELRPIVPEWAQMSPSRLRHVHRVAALVSSWADDMSIPASERNRWLRAAWLHDALRDATPDELERLTPGMTGPVAIRHGPASAAVAKSLGETDRGVLDAIRYHSVGLAEWDMVGRVLYCADYLEPGRPEEAESRAGLARRFPTQSQAVTVEVARRRILRLITTGWQLPEPTYRFWNRLVAPSSSPR